MMTLCRFCRGEVDREGYCRQCGNRSADAWDRRSLGSDAGPFGVSHRGRAHQVNQDAFTVGRKDSWAFMALCDGVSSTADAERAARLAVWEARKVLLAVAGTVEPGEALAAAWESARLRLVEISEDMGTLPSCTFVAVLARGREAWVCSAGDSRAYWLPSDGEAEVLTHDDADALGRLTAWLGSTGPTASPVAQHFSFRADGLLAVCSDGLWKYAETPGRLRSVLSGSPGPLSRSVLALLEFALDSGGYDDVSVALCPVPVPPPPSGGAVRAAPARPILSPDGGRP
ncbi:PP2C family protein-serine/threonine phosphatase [Salininema proteolyticum]|uniref:PP2C family protein-serine/threonine phosphatase n=1 Tax=Salininema proteolyticum TaxID=1607685 RepID=A0ABV8TZ23_9ACTN